MDCCKKESHVEMQEKSKKENDEPTVGSHSAFIENPWKAATLVASTALVLALGFGALVGTGAISVNIGTQDVRAINEEGQAVVQSEDTYDSVVPVSTDLPIVWGDLGTQMLKTGVIDETKLTKLYESRGGMSEMMQSMLYDSDASRVVMTRENANDLLNIFWAFGLSNKNSILENGPMTDTKYGGDPSRFASTGGWPLSTGPVTDHYSVHSFVTLTDEQQSRVERVSQGIYRPCCNNAVYFPDCNHGMAMLGLLELIAANGASEDDMYDVALAVNSFWFPSTYETIAQYFTQNGIDRNTLPAKDILGAQLSSASGFQQVKAAVTKPAAPQGGGGCSV